MYFCLFRHTTYFPTNIGRHRDDWNAECQIPTSATAQSESQDWRQRVKVGKVKSATAWKHSNVPIPDQMAWLLGGHTSSTSHQFWYCNICQRSHKFASWAPELSIRFLFPSLLPGLDPIPPAVFATRSEQLCFICYNQAKDRRILARILRKKHVEVVSAFWGPIQPIRTNILNFTTCSKNASRPCMKYCGHIHDYWSIIFACHLSARYRKPYCWSVDMQVGLGVKSWNFSSF